MAATTASTSFPFDSTPTASLLAAVMSPGFHPVSGGADATIPRTTQTDSGLDATGEAQIDKIRSAQQASLASLSTASAKLTHMMQESDRLYQASIVAFSNHVMTMSTVQSELTSLQNRVSACVARAERIKAVDESRAAKTELGSQKEEKEGSPSKQ